MKRKITTIKYGLIGVIVVLSIEILLKYILIIGTVTIRLGASGQQMSDGPKMYHINKYIYMFDIIC